MSKIHYKFIINVLNQRIYELNLKENQVVWKWFLEYNKFDNSCFLNPIIANKICIKKRLNLILQL